MIPTVQALLQAFQEGYTWRDAARLDEFMELFSPDGAFEFIGTSAVAPGEGEWTLDRKEVREIIEGDWLYWGDLTLDLEKARIREVGSVAWCSLAGVVTQRLSRREGYQNYVNFMRNVLEDEYSIAEAKVFNILRGAANTVFELERGEQFIWPLRFTAVAVQSEAGWRFHQIQFSFPTTRFPDVRLLKHD